MHAKSKLRKSRMHMISGISVLVTSSRWRAPRSRSCCRRRAPARAAAIPASRRRPARQTHRTIFRFIKHACKIKTQEVADMHMISGISVLAIHHLDGEPLGVGAAVGAGPRPGRLQSRRAAVGRGRRVVEGVAAQLCFVAETRISGSQAPGDGLAC